MRYPYGSLNTTRLAGLVGFDYIQRDKFDVVSDFGRRLGDEAGMCRDLGDILVSAWDVGLRVRRHGKILADCPYTEVCELSPGGIGTDELRNAVVGEIAAHGGNPGDYVLAITPRCLVRATDGNAAVVAEVRRRYGPAVAFYAAEEERLGRWSALRTEGNARQWRLIDDLYNRRLTWAQLDLLRNRVPEKVAALARRCIHRAVCRGERVEDVCADLTRRLADGRGLRD